MTLKTIGILGGMGPQATILLQERLLQAVAARDDADHIPLLVDMNPQVPSRIKWLIEGEGVDPAPTLVAMAKRLIDAGAMALAMPCNTAHAFAGDIEGAASVPFLNMPKLAAEELASVVPAGSNIGILASPATQMTNLFADVLSPHALIAEYPLDQAPLLEVIKQIKAGGAGAEELAILNEAAAELIERGCAAIVVGCSEFSLLSGDLTSSVPVVDTMNTLTRHIADFSARCETPSA